MPSEYTLAERKVFVNQILAGHHADFEYKEKPSEGSNSENIDINNIVKERLDILAACLLRADTEYRKSVLSRHKRSKVIAGNPIKPILRRILCSSWPLLG